jgi:hypothetical protein
VELGDWRGETLARVRALITQADPDVVETWNGAACWCESMWEHAASSAPARPTKPSSS